MLASQASCARVVVVLNARCCLIRAWEALCNTFAEIAGHAPVPVTEGYAIGFPRDLANLPHSSGHPDSIHPLMVLLLFFSFHAPLLVQSAVVPSLYRHIPGIPTTCWASQYRH
eukprot:GHUV01014654.1.p2 GENE.GHUV01014654.1~~GHUV01014654.1.p2  ORF type:complete len:113 (-),score=12.90 GHUV01014654.1:196-534(-)